MASNLVSILRSVGFDDREAGLYLAGLELGSAPASSYAAQAHCNRITAYNTLEDLVERGYFTKVRRQRAKWYAPIAPDDLAVEARKNSEALERVLPELRSFRGLKQRKPTVRFYEGSEGIKRVYQDTLTAETELLNFANSQVVREYWPAYDEEYVAQRVERGIRLRGIAPDNLAGRRVHGEDTQAFREIRLVSADEFDCTNEINIYDQRVAICSFGSEEEVFGVIIESREFAETQRQIFEMAWRYAGS